MPTIAVGKDRVNEYFDVRSSVVTVLETQLGSSKIQTTNQSPEGLVEFRSQKLEFRTQHLRERVRSNQ